MDQALMLIKSGQVPTGMNRLVQVLGAKRDQCTDTEWKTFVATHVLTHPICDYLYQDPFTERAFRKPRGYPGDAVVLDYIYHTGVELPSENTLARAIFDYTTNSPAARAVRFRRQLIAQMIDKTAQQFAKPRILSLAAGHLRELDLSMSAQNNQLGEFVAFDQDRRSLERIAQDYAQYHVHTICGTVLQILKGQVNLPSFHFVYAAGLLDYLSQRVSQRLLRFMFDSLVPGGVLLIANYLPGLPEAGYVESLMDWPLIYRTEEEVLNLLVNVPRLGIDEIKLSYDNDKNIVFLSARKGAFAQSCQEYRRLSKPMNGKERTHEQRQQNASPTLFRRNLQSGLP